MELSGPSRLNKFLYFLKKKLFLYFGKRNLLKKLLIFQEGTLRARKIKKTHSEKISFILGNGTF